MIQDQQYMVTLLRLHLPTDNNAKRLTLSLSAPSSQEQFIQNDKLVKQHKVNFYRETLFIDSVESGLFFKCYEFDDHGQKLLIKAFEYNGEELSSVRKHAAMFHTRSEGFQFVWECSVFSAEESELNCQTDKEYTELRDEVRQDDRQFQMDNNFLQAHSNIENGNQEGREAQGIFKRASSTDDTFFAKTPEERNWRLDEDFQIEQQVQTKMKKIQSDVGRQPYKKKTHIKSHLYSQIITELSGLFSGRKL